MVEVFKKAKKGDIVICTYIGGNQKNLTLFKEYEVVKVNQSEWINSLQIQIDSGKKVWFNDRNTISIFMFKRERLEAENEIAIKYVGPRTLVIIRMPFRDDDIDPVECLDKALAKFKNEFAFIIVEDENVDTIQFEYPKNHNSTTPLDFLSDSTKIKSL